MSDIKLLIQSGIYRGRYIYAPSAVNGNENFSPSLLKKSVFSIIDSYFLQGKMVPSQSVFVDLFAGSGQMGIEAASREFGKVFMFELAKERFQHLLETVSDFDSDIQLFHKDSFRFYNKMDIPADHSIVYFLDFPYSFWQEDRAKLTQFVKKVVASYPQNPKLIFIQTNINPAWKDFAVKQYGNNYILVYTNIN